MKSGHLLPTFNLRIMATVIAHALALAFMLSLPLPVPAADGESGVDRANVSSTPEFASNKAKIAQLTQ